MTNDEKRAAREAAAKPTSTRELDALFKQERARTHAIVAFHRQYGIYPWVAFENLGRGVFEVAAWTLWADPLGVDRGKR